MSSPPACLSQCAHARFQTFYNADILEEDAIIEWHTNSPAEGCDAAVKANTAAVKAAAQKFVDWLG